MESQPQNPELRNNPENFHPCTILVICSNGLWCKCIKFFKLIFSCTSSHIFFNPLFTGNP